MTKQAEIDYPLKVEPSLLYEKPYYDATALREFGVALSVLKKWLPSGCKLLDLGCGPGWSSLFLTRAGWKVLGLDISQRMIEIARERPARRKLLSVSRSRTWRNSTSANTTSMGP